MVLMKRSASEAYPCATEHNQKGQPRRPKWACDLWILTPEGKTASSKSHHFSLIIGIHKLQRHRPQQTLSSVHHFAYLKQLCALLSSWLCDVSIGPYVWNTWDFFYSLFRSNTKVWCQSWRNGTSNLRHFESSHQILKSSQISTLNFPDYIFFT